MSARDTATSVSGTSELSIAAQEGMERARQSLFQGNSPSLQYMVRSKKRLHFGSCCSSWMNPQRTLECRDTCQSILPGPQPLPLFQLPVGCLRLECLKSGGQE